MSWLQKLGTPLFNFFFPHICEGCGSDILPSHSNLCSHCISLLPETDYESYSANPVEKKFYGRLPVLSAAACYYFTRQSLIQHLIHLFKYRSHTALGIQLGKLMGIQLKKTGRFRADALVPVPLFENKERKRGFNQATILCRGMSEVTGIPVIDNALRRVQHTESQTRKGRMERWQNIEGKFILERPELIAGKHLLLVDDVITTGATLEACGHALLGTTNTGISIATLCVAMK